MATLAELQQKLNDFQKKVEDRVVDEMKQESPVANTGALKAQVRTLQSVKNTYSVIGSDVSYVAFVVKGGSRNALFPDYFGNRKSVHNQTNSDFSAPRYIGGTRAWTYVRNARPNPFVSRTRENLRKIDWNDVFWS